MNRRSIFAGRCVFKSKQNHFYHRPLIPLTLSLAGGISMGGLCPGYLNLSGIVVAATAIALIYGCTRDHRQHILPLLLMASLGYMLISPWMSDDFPAQHVTHFTDSEKWRIEGQVTEILPSRHGRMRLVMRVTQLEDRKGRRPVKGNIRLTVSEEVQGLSKGDRLIFRSRLRSFRNFNNPGGFDYQRYMRFQRISASAFVAADHLQVVVPPNKVRSSLLDRYRVKAQATIGQLADPDTRAIMQALLIGERQAITQELRGRFNRCGASHLIAISGLHIGIVGGLLVYLFRGTLNRMNWILDRGWGRRGAILLALGPVVFYAVLAGLSPATQRALIMVMAVMATYFAHKEGDPLNFVALAALLMLVWHPPILFSISFQLSFVAVIWIILGLSAAPKDKPMQRSALFQAIAKIVVFMKVTFWATAGTLPFVMLYFQQISLIGLLTNLLLVPLIGFIVLPIGLVSLFLIPVDGWVAGWGIQLAGWVLSHTLTLMAWIDTHEGIALTTFIPSTLEITAYYGLLLVVALRTQLRCLPWFAVVVLGVLGADALYWSYERYWHQDLRVTVLDVGQGSAALIEFPGGRTMLIDGGGFSSNRYFDVGARIVAPFLRHRKILQVDTVALSHPSSDHMNGLVYILTHFQPQTLLWTGQQASTASFRQFMSAVVRSGVDVPPFDRMDRAMMIGGVQVDILYPLKKNDRDRGAPSGERYNNHSMVIKLTMGSSSILFPGDVEKPAEIDLLNCCQSNLASRVLVAPHHGSRTSSSPDFLAAVRPVIVIISAGQGNRFGLPHADVLKRCQMLTDKIYRTDRHGAVHLRTKGRQWLLKTQ